MKRKSLFYVCMALLMATGFVGCSSDDVDENIVEPVDDDAQFVLIQSDSGETSKGYLYKKGDCYDGYPQCYIARGIRRVNGSEELSVYMMKFMASIKKSDVFNLLTFECPESYQPMHFRDMKPGDTLDFSQFHVIAYYAHIDRMEGAIASSGKITVVGTKMIDGQSYMTLNLSDLRFLSRDRSCVYTINGTVDYEICTDLYDNEVE